jgi:hypothetical protein
MFTPPALPLFVATCLLVNTTRILTPTPVRHVIAPVLITERKYIAVRTLAFVSLVEHCFRIMLAI